METKLKRILKTIAYSLRPIKPLLVYIFEAEAWLSKKWVSAAHKRLFWVTWGIPKNPEFFDHQIDLFYFWRDTRNIDWLERGVFSSLTLKRGGNLLEIACGDGFNTRNFYSEMVKHVVACDFDKKAIATARRKNRAPNIEYILSDIRDGLPAGDFDSIIWDSAIEHFTPAEINSIMTSIKRQLAQKNGILSGSTLVERTDGKKSLEQHEYEFKNMADLKRFFTPYFKNVIVFETIYPYKHNLYFWASDGTIPFSENWTHWIKENNQN